MDILKLNNISFSYGKKQILKDLNFEFESGRLYAITGKSGSGKSTLLSILSGLNSPTSGTITYNDVDINEIDKYKYRSKYVGVIFQSFNLLPKLTAVENVELSMDIAGIRDENTPQRALDLLESVGIDADEAHSRILKLSGGQQQRVAIARALSYDPGIILADEPTGNLDEETQASIIDILKELAAGGKCVVVVTHSPTVAKAADVVYEIQRLKKSKKSKSSVKGEADTKNSAESSAKE
ncbi:MAG: ABC transporter ATP-binding protein [Firmicutes bacterium]|nr:ABC transporter ATP-binding protein [Bacillota bacterium]